MSRPERGGQSSSEFRKRRRLAGEDDTDRDLRLAREDAAENESRQQQQQQEAAKRHSKNDAPLMDHAGHIQLFGAPSLRVIRAEKNAEAEAEKKKKEREFEDQYTMRFSNAAGFKTGIKDKPWYATAREDVGYSGTEELGPQALAELGKDAFGRRDDGRNRRDEMRLRTADPMAVMKKAQMRLKEVGREREVWAMEKKRDMREIENTPGRFASKLEPKRRRTDENELEEFSLDSVPGGHATILKHENSSREQSRANGQKSYRTKRKRSRSRERNDLRSFHRLHRSGQHSKLSSHRDAASS